MTKTWDQLYNNTLPLLKKFYPHYESAKDVAKKWLQQNVQAGQVVLDLGCGTHSEDFVAIKSKIRLVGVDFSAEAGQINTMVDEFQQVDLNAKLPFNDQTFDLVYSRFVVEHLAQPKNTYAEVYRVLKPGSYFLLLAPNLYNPIILLSRILPHFLHTSLKSGLSGTKEEEVYPTYYRSNTAGKIRKQLTACGFKNLEIKRHGGVFEYFMASKTLFFLGIIWERLTDLVAKFTKLHLVIIAQK